MSSRVCVPFDLPPVTTTLLLLVFLELVTRATESVCGLEQYIAGTENRGALLRLPDM